MRFEKAGVDEDDLRALEEDQPIQAETNDERVRTTCRGCDCYHPWMGQEYAGLTLLGMQPWLGMGWADLGSLKSLFVGALHLLFYL